jgi:nucleoside-diphosphate-sugar epimerase
VRQDSNTSALKALGAELVIGDLTRPASLEGAIEGVSHVFHCAALVSDWATAEEIRAVNVLGTRSLLEVSAAASVRRFIHFSTTDVYGHPGTRAVEEGHPATRFANWYAQSKREAEAEVRRAEWAGLEAVILRPATVYGPGSNDVIGEIARAIVAGHMLLIARGRPVAGLVHVENLIDAALGALHHTDAPGRAFNVSDGLPVTWRRLTDDLAEGLGAPRVRWSMPYPLAAGIGLALESGYRAMRARTGISTAPLLSRQAVQVLGIDQDFSNRRLRRTLGWEPKTGYEEGLAGTLEWLRREFLQRDAPRARSHVVQ